MTIAWPLAGLLVAAGSVAVARDLDGSEGHQARRPAILLVVLLGTVAAGASIAQTTATGVGDGTARMALLGAFVFASLCWFAFVAEYTGRGPRISRTRAAVLVLLGCTTVASTTITWLQEIGRIDVGTVGTASYLTTFLLQIAVFSLGLLGVVSIAHATVTYDDLPARHGGPLAAVGLLVTTLPFSVQIGQQLGEGTTFSIAFVQLGGIVALCGVLQRSGGLFEQAPTAGHLARETVLETLSDPVIVTDRNHRILDANAAATATFDVDRSDVRDQRLSEVAGVTEDTELEGTVSIRTTAGRREFAVSRNAIDDANDAPLGVTYRFHDVTDRQTREQRLSVLNRLMRHNLRNDLDAIRGFAEPIRDGAVDPDDASDQFERIEHLATDLVELSSAVERSGRVLSDAPLTVERCDLCTLAESAARPHDETTVATAADGPAALHTDPELVRLVLDELVDNALEHSHRDEPSVRIAVDTTGTGGTLAVRDDGPGIPEHEQRVLLDGAETPVAHGSGIGLWLVRWAVTKLGGRLEFTATDSDGAEVIVHLPDLGESSGGEPVRADP
ncbi:ATP-binding protein [Salinarchaeum laminariae]|uniref:ATP-binding protein n=1 Tax=Salinarchaeum laminariae TaxID=869888 RepID=UPI0020C06E14|nr:ATP-binding protein [Salinarchaeum laminariae]